jgi:2,3-dimethylmalate lyase
MHFLSQNSGPAAFRNVMAEANGPVCLPGCYDALGARLIEQAGFDVVYMTGFGTSASLLGRPDVGLLTGSEMMDNARRIVSAVSKPVIADADTGYGNAINVMRTIRDYEQAGVAGVHLEDQVTPKRCGHMEGKEVVSATEFAGKLRAARDARSNPDFFLIARTDARATHGLDEARRRAHLALESGADALFIEALQNLDEIEKVATEFASAAPLVFNWADGGKTPPLSYDEIAALGFAIIIMPITALLAATAAMSKVFSVMKRDGTPKALAGTTIEAKFPLFGEFTDLIGLPEFDQARQEYA